MLFFAGKMCEKRIVSLFNYLGYLESKICWLHGELEVRDFVFLVTKQRVD